jgi:hypothetical protein
MAPLRILWFFLPPGASHASLIVTLGFFRHLGTYRFSSAKDHELGLA